MKVLLYLWLLLLLFLFCFVLSPPGTSFPWEIKYVRKCDNHDRGGKTLSLMTELNVLLKAIVIDASLKGNSQSLKQERCFAWIARYVGYPFAKIREKLHGIRAPRSTSFHWPLE